MLLQLGPPPKLRPYQTGALDGLRAMIAAGRRRLALICPTGGGKTVIASEMVRGAVTRGNPVVFIAHRKELIDQTCDKLERFGVEAGVVMAQDHRRDATLPVQVCSIQTLARRMDRLPPGKLVIVDECHHATSNTYRQVLDEYPHAVVIGLTATPFRQDKRGLADLFEDSVLAATPAELMALGALVNYDAFAYDAPDLHEVKVTAGDYNQKQLAIACNTEVLVGSVVREYLSKPRGRRAIVFPVNIEHSLHLVDEFRSAGIAAEHVDCDTPKETRGLAMARFRSGDLTVLSSVGVLTEGFDAPAAEVCILARPTKSIALHLQMIGRVLRPSPETGKVRALIHDHAGNLLRHGLVEDDRDYSLKPTPPRVRALLTCPLCCAIVGSFRTDGTCPKCNELVTPPTESGKGSEPKEKKIVEGVRLSKEQIQALRNRRLGEGLRNDLTDDQLTRAATATRDQKAAEYLRLAKVAAERGFKWGWVGHQYRETFGVWPQFRDEELQNIDPAEKPFLRLPPKRSAA